MVDLAWRRRRFVAGSLTAAGRAPANVRTRPGRTARAGRRRLNVYIVWESRREGNYDVFPRRVSRDGGASYGPRQPERERRRPDGSHGRIPAAQCRRVERSDRRQPGGAPPPQRDAGGRLARRRTSRPRELARFQLVLAGGTFMCSEETSPIGDRAPRRALPPERRRRGDLSPAVELADTASVQLGASGRPSTSCTDATFGSGDLLPQVTDWARRSAARSI